MPFQRLTPRQLEVADLICLEDLSVVAIAKRLGVPIATARTHVRDIAVKLANPYGLPAYRLIQSYAPARKIAAVAEQQRVFRRRRAHAAGRVFGEMLDEIAPNRDAR